MRLSNLAPHSASSFSFLKHLAKGDIIFSNSGAIVIIKWAKTLQLFSQAKLLHLPFLNNELCPVRALRECLSSVPGGNNAPLLQYKLNGVWTPMTDSRVRNHLKNVLQLLGRDASFITFHTLRRSGASFAFNHNVSLQNIQRHGT